MTLTESYYDSPLGKISLVATDHALLGAWFLGQAYFQAGLDRLPQRGTNAILQAAASWLDTYFEGNPTAISINLVPKGPLFNRTFGKPYARFPMEKRSPMDNSQHKLPVNQPKLLAQLLVVIP